ncbi:hypothetical protein RUMCAL_00183 [Ruminococcus callidus ATCC 27760]|uniref:Uncharacterized protein n=1 Tax=Ruminococcus callidus ATCC 27760 TaxID=411473 RepID=U2KZ54_9FIRM|nr:hypothetical protein RUMCAL_00183 [Ruminococcus callidus ATCC 27760]DAI16139.1 MAG TPA: hypothetical protein [Caudoviricetes sp.]
MLHIYDIILLCKRENFRIFTRIFGIEIFVCYNGNIKRKSEEVCLCISTLAIQNIVPPVPAGLANGKSAIILAQDLRSAVQ